MRVVDAVLCFLLCGAVFPTVLRIGSYQKKLSGSCMVTPDRGTQIKKDGAAELSCQKSAAHAQCKQVQNRSQDRVGRNLAQGGRALELGTKIKNSSQKELLVTSSLVTPIAQDSSFG